MPTDIYRALVLALLVCFVWAFKSHYRLYSRTMPLPPGPPPEGLLSGNKSDVKTPYAWRRYNELAREYGNILYLRMYRRRFIILHSLEDAVELFERRSKTYSSRPVVPMWDLMGFGGTSTSTRAYGQEWRMHRRIFNQVFKPDSTLSYRPIQTKKMQDMLYRLLNDPEDYEQAIYTYAGAIILSVTYGYDALPKDDPYVELAEYIVDAFALGPQPKWLVNSFPLLRHVPSWFPGASFKRFADSVRVKLARSREVPFQFAINSGSSYDSHIPVVTKLLGNYSSPYESNILKEAAGSAYGAGVGTPRLDSFGNSGVSYHHGSLPRGSKKAQAEIDRVTNGQRLPEYDDQQSLPYMQAVIREVFRYSPINPIGFPHLSSEDDTFKGYYIPKGSIVHANVWAIAHDPERYNDPEAFNPERFLTEGELNNDNMVYVFGFGRRVCPGRHLGLASIWLSATAILASFNIVQKKDENGRDIPVGAKFTDTGVISIPYDFQLALVPRSEKARQIILECLNDS